MKRLWIALGLAAAATAADAKVVGTPVDYMAGTTTLKGYLAVDDAPAKAPRPAVLVVHEWWGLNDYARMRADKLAELGYAALAVDMYGDGRQAAHPQEAGAFSKAVFDDFAASKARFQAAVELMRKTPGVDPKRVAAIGYCLGGAVVLNMARQGADLKGVASFHGSPFAIKPAEKGVTKAKVLFCTGAKDPMIPAEQVENFKKEMEDAKVDAKIVVYPDATHSFTNPGADAKAKEFGLPLAYDPDADAKSWEELKVFLKKALGR